MTKPKIAVLVGPTACGKTDTAVELAKKLDGEIIQRIRCRYTAR